MVIHNVSVKYNYSYHNIRFWSNMDVLLQKIRSSLGKAEKFSFLVVSSLSWPASVLDSWPAVINTDAAEEPGLEKLLKWTICLKN